MIEGAFDQVGRRLTETISQVFGLAIESPADVMQQTHGRHSLFKHMIVACIVAISSRVLGARVTASAWTTVSVRPDLMTSARAKNISPFAGRSKLTLNSTLNTSEPTGISV